MYGGAHTLLVASGCFDGTFAHIDISGKQIGYLMEKYKKSRRISSQSTRLGNKCYCIIKYTFAKVKGLNCDRKGAFTPLCIR